MVGIALPVGPVVLDVVVDVDVDVAVEDVFVELLVAVVVIDTGVPVFTGYRMPVDGQVPASGAEMGTNTPSITDPIRLKYHDIPSRVFPSQSRDGAKPPDCVVSAEVSASNV